MDCISLLRTESTSPTSSADSPAVPEELPDSLWMADWMPDMKASAVLILASSPQDSEPESMTWLLLCLPLLPCLCNNGCSEECGVLLLLLDLDPRLSLRFSSFNFDVVCNWLSTIGVSSSAVMDGLFSVKLTFLSMLFWSELDDDPPPRFEDLLFWMFCRWNRLVSLRLRPEVCLTDPLSEADEDDLLLLLLLGLLLLETSLSGVIPIEFGTVSTCWSWLPRTKLMRKMIEIQNFLFKNLTMSHLFFKTCS